MNWTVDAGTWRRYREKIAASLILLVAVGLSVQFDGRPQLTGTAQAASGLDRHLLSQPGGLTPPNSSSTPSSVEHSTPQGNYCPADKDGSGSGLCKGFGRGGSVLGTMNEVNPIALAQSVAGTVGSVAYGVFSNCTGFLTR